MALSPEDVLPDTIEFQERLSDRLASKMARQMFNGALTPGEKLPTEAELSKQWGVGRGTIREAVRALSDMKLVHCRRGSGIQALDFRQSAGFSFAEAVLEEEPDPAMWMEILTFREWMLPSIVKIFAFALTRLTMADVKLLEGLDKQVLDALEAGDEYAALDAEMAWRSHIMGLSGNLFVQLFENSLKPLAQWLILASFQVDDRKQQNDLRANLLRFAVMNKVDPETLEPMLLDLFKAQNDTLKHAILTTHNETNQFPKTEKKEARHARKKFPPHG